MNFAEKIKFLIGKKVSEPPASLDYTPLDFVKNRKAILKELVLSKQSGKLIGVYSRALGEGMFLTGVEAILSHGDGKDELIVFNRYDMSGHLLARTKVSLNEIHMVCPFNKTFQTPAYSA
ncbi:hypothetical protein KK083_26040 [Fulvivirgaceae bacterium PWU4]|uniref:Uncharacterized protein n=1 Tax=Chryseosolibacter histidini TaxID=2782349 RepID=A0AAP2GRU2_9BACT|nr:hypothetical protein [Chryseosolibacter histidini]MBT1700375.1 hypothetical protein [Chryseosolibacter histidini]